MKEPEQFDCIIGRYKDDSEGKEVGDFILAVTWFTCGIFTGLLLAGVMLQITAV